jgi:hypothetical protein
MSDLPHRLSEGQHPIEVVLRPHKTMVALKESLERGHLNIRFTGTRGGTELGVPLESERSDLSQINFEEEQGRFTIAGRLTLDYVPVRCVADIELPSLQGRGHLEILSE